MALTDARPSRLLAVVAAALFLVTACGGANNAPASSAGSPTPAPTATAVPTPRPTPLPTPTPTASPTASPSATPVAEAVAAVKIGAPYKLVANPANKALSASIEITIAGQHITETITGREIHKGGSVVGMLLVLQFHGIPMNSTVFEGAAKGAANTVGGKLAYTTILGWKVAIITADGGTVALFRLHNNIVMVLGTKARDTKPLATSVIKANK